jgi:hypothetical protein
MAAARLYEVEIVIAASAEVWSTVTKKIRPWGPGWPTTRLYWSRDFLHRRGL